MKAFWLKPRQIVVMDAHGGRPAKNYYLKPLTLMLILAVITGVPFVVGAWFTPFHGIQQIIPENLKLKRQNDEFKRNISELETLSRVKDEQIDSLKEQIAAQEVETLELTKELHMFKTILGERKGKGVQVLQHQASWEDAKTIAWQSLFVKGGSLPRYLSGTYEIFALDVEGNRSTLSGGRIKYRFETHAFLKGDFEWKEDWRPVQLELLVYDSRRNEVLSQTIEIEGK